MILKKIEKFFYNGKNIISSLQKMPKSQFYLYIAILAFPFFLMVYQGCKSSSLDAISSPSEDNSGNRKLHPTTPIDYDRGYIVQIDSLTEEVIEDNLLSLDSEITFKFMNTHTNSDSYKWTIKRGFESIVTDDLVKADTYQTKFTQSGAYDIFAKSYESETFLNAASKRVVVGASCDLTDILEIKLLSGSLTVNQSATFGLKDNSDFSSIQWKATLPSKEIVEETTDTIELSFANEGDLIIEVSATGADSSKSECLTYRRKSLEVISNLTPYFNPITLTDGTNELATLLENNNIYKYRRPTNQYLQIEVLHAHTCEYQIDEGDKTEFTCSHILIDIGLDSNSSCIEKTISLSASDETKSQEASRVYYNYCPQSSDYCYIGPTTERQSHHICQPEEDQEDDAPETDPVNGSCDNSIQNGCISGVANDSAITDTDTHYRWHCEGLNGGNTQTNCQKQILQGIINGVCDNSKRNSCTYGTADDSALEDTETHYRWQCIGTGGGLTEDCQKEKSQNSI